MSQSFHWLRRFCWWGFQLCYVLCSGKKKERKKRERKHLSEKGSSEAIGTREAFQLGGFDNACIPSSWY